MAKKKPSLVHIYEKYYKNFGWNQKNQNSRAGAEESPRGYTAGVRKKVFRDG
jgi:hypothetical protein